MKKIILVAMVLGLLVSNICFAQNVCFRNICLDMDWRVYMKNVALGQDYSIEKIEESCTGYQVKTDNCIKARIGYPLSGFKEDKDRIGKISVDFINGRVAGIEIRIYDADVDSTILAIHEKWGKPHNRETSTYQNPYGAKVDGWLESWSVGSNHILLSKTPLIINEIVYAYELLTSQQFILKYPPKPKPKI
jgi:hypothetical protein